MHRRYRSIVSRYSKRILIASIVLVLAVTTNLSCHAQTAESLYKLNFHQYNNHGNHPQEVAKYWNLIGIELILKLHQGVHQNLKDRERIMEELIEIHGDWKDADHLENMILEQLKSSTVTGEEKQKYDLELIKKAERTFEILGAEFARQLSLSDLQQKISIRGNAKRPDVLRIHIATEAFQELLELTPEQRKQITHLVEEAEKEFATSIKETIGKVQIQSDKVWREMLDDISDDDRKRVEELIGQPVAWYSQFNVPAAWSRTVRRRPFRKQRQRKFFYGSNVDNKANDQGRWPEEFEIAELEAKGIKKFDKLLFDLVSDEFAANYLSLTPNQLRQWKSIEDDLLKNAILIETDPADRLQELEIAENAYPKSILEWLSKDQLIVLRWLEGQARLNQSRRGGPSVYNLATELIGKPNLARRHKFQDSELNAIHRIEHDKWRSDRLKTMEVREFSRGEKNAFKIYSEKERVEAELNDKLKALLTEEQRKKHEEFTTWVPPKQYK